MANLKIFFNKGRTLAVFRQFFLWCWREGGGKKATFSMFRLIEKLV